MQFSTVAIAAAFAATASAAYSNVTTVTEDITVTGYTTYCPESTVVTITKCESEKCAPTAITVSSATTLIITEPCVVPTTYTTEVFTVTSTVSCEECHKTKTTVAGESTKTTVAGESTAATSSAAATSSVAAVSSYEAGAAKQAAGAVAGLAAVAAAFL